MILDNSKPLIELTGIGKHFETGSNLLSVLHQVSLTINRGEFVAIMGPSGSGKSSLINLLGLLDEPTSGTIRIAGRDTTDLSSDQQAAIRSQYIGFIFQAYNLLPRRTAIENVALPLVYQGVPKVKRVYRARQALHDVGLANRCDHLPSQLSGGEQQRVAIARALITEPKIILADEPTGALDSQSSEQVLQLLMQASQHGYTVIMVTHDKTIAKHCSRIITLSDGAIVDDHDKRHTSPEILPFNRQSYRAIEKTG